jgi:hypothetical protein
MKAIIVRYQFHDPSPNVAGELVKSLKQTFGGAVNFVAEGTILIDTSDSADRVYELLAPSFTFDDKLFVGELENFRALHSVSRSRPSIHKLAI